MPCNRKSPSEFLSFALLPLMIACNSMRRSGSRCFRILLFSRRNISSDLNSCRSKLRSPRTDVSCSRPTIIAVSLRNDLPAPPPPRKREREREPFIGDSLYSKVLAVVIFVSRSRRNKRSLVRSPGQILASRPNSSARLFRRHQSRS